MQAFYVRDIIQGKIKIPDQEKQQQWLDIWKAKQAKFAVVQDAPKCQAEYMAELLSESNYPKKWDTELTNKVCFQWIDTKLDNIMTFRDQCFTSNFSGVKSIPVKKPWLQNFDDSIESYLNNGIDDESKAKS